MWNTNYKEENKKNETERKRNHTKHTRLHGFKLEINYTKIVVPLLSPPKKLEDSQYTSEESVGQKKKSQEQLQIILN